MLSPGSSEFPEQQISAVAPQEAEPHTEHTQPAEPAQALHNSIPIKTRLCTSSGIPQPKELNANLNVCVLRPAYLGGLADPAVPQLPPAAQFSILSSPLPSPSHWQVLATSHTWVRLGETCGRCPKVLPTPKPFQSFDSVCEAPSSSAHLAGFLPAETWVSRRPFLFIPRAPRPGFSSCATSPSLGGRGFISSSTLSRAGVSHTRSFPPGTVCKSSLQSMSGGKEAGKSTSPPPSSSQGLF